MDADRLAAISLFADLSSDDRERIAAKASEKVAAIGDVLASHGDFGYAVYAIESGTAEVSVDGRLLRVLGPGDVFGEIAVLASGRWTASVVATSPLQLIALFNRDVWALEREAPGAAERLRALIAERQTATAS